MLSLGLEGFEGSNSCCAFAIRREKALARVFHGVCIDNAHNHSRFNTANTNENNAIKPHSGTREGREEGERMYSKGRMGKCILLGGGVVEGGV